jgi:hypothetical protein
MIDVDQLLENAVGESAPVDVSEVRQRVDRRRRRRRTVWAGAAAAVVLVAASGGLTIGGSEPDQLTTAGPDSTNASTPPSEPGMTVPDGWVTVTLDALHQGEEVFEPVTLWVWVEPLPDPALGPYIEPRWEALYQNIELGPSRDATAVGSDLYMTQLTTVVPPAAAQLITSFDDDESAWMAVTPQPDEGPVACSNDPDHPPCPHYPRFTPPDYAADHE